ncbi:hypothetical protein A1Q1_01103 [Trichosporon asahii var. asahii CBS 2479]|uniref:F-box domain-containing protein n=1 Tax=Trichosporon asahii var. asahii (strain ATCC 90039 / CBS 2479 / JCM 2466 / KCTC 7840 / NBRC 103889/ NCYC 2677 / UAMH 7654) TaxID=1186058 RepID=J6F3D8_TRIAS|nr:hypothetical protein A1Q1_01103 [Trichosporon asahii var. asahii CBS 2479]EJT49747.1 hypothetical protein A1Q1_01103 [Trichosporon asahii var. asahii CBS 2479]
MKRKRLSSSPLAGLDSSPPVRVTIDHCSFPHIIDVIFASLSYPGLIRCAQVCKEWREKARPLLFKHVAIYEDTSRNSTVIRSRDVAWSNESIILATAPSTKTNALSLVAKSKIVDSHYKGFENGTFLRFVPGWPAAFHRLLNSDSTEDNSHLRRRSDSLSGGLGWTDVVHFVDYSDGNFIFATDSARSPTTLTLSVNCYSNPTSPSHAITSAYPFAFDELRFDSSNVTTYAILLNDCMDQEHSSVGEVSGAGMSFAAAQGEISIVECQNPRLGAVCELLSAIVDCASIESIAVVGLDAFVDAESLVAHVRGVCKSVRPFSGDPGAEDGVLCLDRFLRFYSHDQYCGLIGEERYRLLTVR